MTAKPCYTHKGWFWFCPGYLAFEQEGFAVEARSIWLEPLFSLSNVIEQLRIFVTSWGDPDYEPTFMVRVTGEL